MLDSFPIINSGVLLFLYIKNFEKRGSADIQLKFPIIEFSDITNLSRPLQTVKCLIRELGPITKKSVSIIENPILEDGEISYLKIFIRRNRLNFQGNSSKTKLTRILIIIGIPVMLAFISD
jgi:hypothetical protein